MTTRVHERHDESYGSWFDATAILETVRSEHQEIQVIETAKHGRVMLIDGLTMLTEDTHFVYHEHMAHIPAACVDTPRAALIIGGGDGGVVTELVKHDSLESIVLAELDAAVIDVSRRWFPSVSAGLDDPRVTIEIGDGAAYVAAQRNAFDLVIIDSTDICEEVTRVSEVALPLASDDFYDSLKAAMRPGAAAIQILGSPVFYRAGMGKILPRLNRIWPRFEVVSIPAPFYISGDWAAGLFAVDGALEPRRFPASLQSLNYINAETAKGALAQPNYLRKMIGVG